ncbi:flagellar protein FlgN [Phyllobacterium sp. 0TCS1.6C]|uniref:flagellar protein FlgN n=1 Tax=unclassified Phyllobacterium TaxID=2638441 RepID=UPI002264535F|nr:MULTISPECIES: flagellar protein FlgN [unclassified Phyllobacterium]MCX8280913.1 flagellar protein FlgN [Phyllobacterium sp. 0TCS1.6C]MCX8295779.1 flagellar protein FlgN [Phyllobacterium sp. 0TCS1.6A]
MTINDTKTHEIQRLDQALAPVYSAIQRLESVIDHETDLLLDGSTVDLKEISASKSRGLRDFNKALGKATKIVDQGALKTLQPLLESLRRKLDRNCDALKLHLRAVSELTGIIRDALETHEADGTYTVEQLRSGSGA